MPQKLCGLIVICFPFSINPGYLASKLAKDVSEYFTWAKSALLILLEEKNYHYVCRGVATTAGWRNAPASAQRESTRGLASD